MKEDEKRNLLLNECVRYLKKSSAFQKLLAGFREKYRSLGHWGGTVVLKELSREERMDLGGFLAKDLLKKDVADGKSSERYAVCRVGMGGDPGAVFWQTFDYEKSGSCCKEYAEGGFFQRNLILV